MAAAGSAVVGGAVKAGGAVGGTVVSAGTAVGSAMAGGAGFVYEKGKAATLATAEKTKAVVVLLF